MGFDGDGLWRIVELSRDALDDLPFGAIVVDHRGTILEYNRYEAALSRLDPHRVVGLNFFRDVAPCTAVREFQGKLKEFAGLDGRVSDAFGYFFPFAHGTVDVTIRFLRLDKRRILIAVERVEPATRA